MSEYQLCNLKKTSKILEKKAFLRDNITLKRKVIDVYRLIKFCPLCQL